MLAALVWGLWAYETGYKKSAVALAALATGVKWVTLPLLPFFSRFGYARSILIVALVLALPALFFWETLPQLVTGFLHFGSGGSFNGPIYELLFRGLDLSRETSLLVVLVCFSGILLWRWRGAPHFAMDSQIRWVLGALLVFAPTVHFWYLAWVMPFVCLRPTLPWILISISSGVYFMVWSRAADGVGWGLSVAQQSWFWGPFGLGLLYEFWSTRGRCAFAPERPVGEDSESVAVVIPTLNAGAFLARALQSVAEQRPKVREVIVVDGGSTDNTVAVAEAAPLPVRVLVGAKGRGNQIAMGIEAASSEWVIILHADAILEPGSCEVLLRAVRAMPRVIGGAFGQRFEGRHAELVPIEVLNDLRALFTRTSFGDQIQFLHRSRAVRDQLMPPQPLMEDVESSWRIREQGEFLFLGYSSEVCHRRWRAAAWLKRFALVMRLVSRYRWARLRSRSGALRLSRELYEEYYS
jgi:GT2 family glycosyltransferase